MIKVKVEKENEKVKKIVIKGHAQYDDYGKDIVCASVSSILTTTVNAILKIDKDAISYDEEGFAIEILKDDETINKLINNMLDLFKELEDEYPKNIKFL